MKIIQITAMKISSDEEILYGLGEDGKLYWLNHKWKKGLIVGSYWELEDMVEDF
mgnify:CR=1 FL=1